MEKYDELIYYSICECLYEEMKKNKVSSKNVRFKTLCNGISINVLNDIPLSNLQWNILNESISRLELIYGETNENLVKYIVKFFEEKMWDKYDNIVITLKKNLPFAMP